MSVTWALLSAVLLAATFFALPHENLKPRAATLPTCTETKSNGFTHPGIHHNCASLNRIQSQIAAGLSPFKESLDFVISRSGFMKPDTWSMAGPFVNVTWAGADGHNTKLQSDGKAAYIMTLGWYATGNSTWLGRSISVARAWSTTLSYLNEHIQGGEGITYMTAAAEILRSSSE